MSGLGKKLLNSATKAVTKHPLVETLKIMRGPFLFTPPKRIIGEVIGHIDQDRLRRAFREMEMNRKVGSHIKMVEGGPSLKGFCVKLNDHPVYGKMCRLHKDLFSKFDSAEDMLAKGVVSLLAITAPINSAVKAIDFILRNMRIEYM